MILETLFDELVRLANAPNAISRMRAVVRTLPPLAEQRRIAANVDQPMALVEQLESQLTASSATVEKLMEALVAELTGSVA